MTIAGGTSNITYYLVDDVSVVESDTKASAGPDKHVGIGDSVFIGNQDMALDCYWTVLGSSAVIGTGAGIWVKPTVTTSYVIMQTLCGTVTKDTVKVEVWAAGVNSINGQAQEYRLSPNPSNGIIELSQSVSDPLPVAVSVCEATGKQVYSAPVSFRDKTASLNLSGLASGFYYVQLRDGRGNSYMIRFIRQ